MLQIQHVNLKELSYLSEEGHFFSALLKSGAFF